MDFTKVFLTKAPAIRAMAIVRTIPNEEPILTLMGNVAMEPKALDRPLPDITCDKNVYSDWQDTGS